MMQPHVERDQPRRPTTTEGRMERAPGPCTLAPAGYPAWHRSDADITWGVRRSARRLRGASLCVGSEAPFASLSSRDMPRFRPSSAQEL